MTARVYPRVARRFNSQSGNRGSCSADPLDPPVQLAPERAEEALPREPYERDLGTPPADEGAVARGDRRALLPVDRQEHLFSRRPDFDRDDRFRRADGRPDGQGVGAARGREDTVHGGRDDGAAGRERVGGRARGRGDDDPIRAVRADLLAVVANVDGEADDASETALV